MGPNEFRDMMSIEPMAITHTKEGAIFMNEREMGEIIVLVGFGAAIHAGAAFGFYRKIQIFQKGSVG